MLIGKTRIHTPYLTETFLKRSLWLAIIQLKPTFFLNFLKQCVNPYQNRTPKLNSL